MSLIGGVRPPIAVLSALLLALVGVTALTLGNADREPVSKAVLLSQQRFAEDGAIALRAAVDESVTDLTRSAGLLNAAPAVSPDAALDKLGSVYQKWRGTAVVEASTGKLKASRGEHVPLNAIDRAELAGPDGLGPRMVRLPNGETRLLTLAVLSWPGQPQQLLIASSSLRFPGIALGQFRAIAVVDPEGAVLSSDGISPPEQVLTDLQRKEVAASRKQLGEFATVAARHGKVHPLKSKAVGEGGYQGVSGHLVGGEYLSERAVAGYATLATPQPGEATVATGLGLTVVAMVKVPEDTGAAVGPLGGLVAAGALLLIGLLVVAVLLRFLQRPLIQLFLESRRLARGDLGRPVTVPAYGEAAHIGTALETLRGRLAEERGAPGPSAPAAQAPPHAPAPTFGAAPRRRRPGVRVLLAGCAVLLAAWAVPVGLLLNRAGDTTVVPQQLVNDQRERTETLSDRVRRALNEGHADLVSVASLLGEKATPAQHAKALERALREHPRYQALYVVDASGTVTAKAGDAPGRTGAVPATAPPVEVRGRGGKEPRIVGQAPLPGAREGAAVVGEFRVDYLNSLLKRPGLGEIRIVDADRKVLAGNTGYRAFQSLGERRIDELVLATNTQTGKNVRPGGVVYRDGSGAQIAAAAPFTGGGAAKELGWTVVSWQPAGALDIYEYRVQNRTTLAGMLCLTLAAACLGWLYIVVAGPLRHLADQAEALAGGDWRTVLYPRHHDEVGAITRSLEMIRQQLRPGRN